MTLGKTGGTEDDWSLKGLQSAILARQFNGLSKSSGKPFQKDFCSTVSSFASSSDIPPFRKPLAMQKQPILTGSGFININFFNTP